MWWHGQNLDKPIAGPDGTVWHFRVWHDHVDGIYTQRIFFWDDQKTETGLLELRDDQAIHVKRIKDRLAKLAKDCDYRRQFLRPLQFPIERHW